MVGASANGRKYKNEIYLLVMYWLHMKKRERRTY
jgi:hypothetical protein